MWKVIDEIVGETVEAKDYMSAYEDAERRVTIHGLEFPYKHRGYHHAIQCEMVEDKANRTITIRERD